MEKESNREIMKDKDLVKLLQKNGWKLARINGSHHILQKLEQTESIPVHGKDVPTGLLNAILKRTGLK
jgi:predicted RNA binding protein YcfA (HicA-like mRNA interferase family)